jgi:transposase
MSVHSDDDELLALRARVAQLQSSMQALQDERDAAQKQAEHAQKQAEHAQKQAEHATRDAKSAQALAERLKLRIKRLAYLLYGRRSEKLSAQELGQLLLSFGGSEQDAYSAEPAVPAPAAPEESVGTPVDQARGGTRKRTHRGRTRLSPEIERVVTKVAVPQDERACKCCGMAMTAITPREHERVEYVPDKLVVHIEQREVLVCKASACRGDAVTAERAHAPAVVRRAGASLLAQLIESKCDDAMPIHRQRDRFSRLGFTVPLNTLYDYFAYGTDLLGPVAKTTLSVLLGEPYVNVDDTKLKVLDRTHRRGRYLGHLWCFASPRKLIAYLFTQSWSAEEIAPYLGAIDGFIQCDDYKGYGSRIILPDKSTRVLVPPERRLGCMMHVRRRFHDALQLGDKRAAEPIAFIRELYAIEAQAKAAQMDAAARLALRTDQSLPWLDKLEAWVDVQQRMLLPKERLGEACGYAHAQHVFVRRCFSDGRFEIDNGLVERAIREPAIGRRNFHFTGSEQAAERLAAAYTLVQSCRALGISTRDYLIDVLTKIEAGWPLRRIAELVPDRWALERGLLTQSPQPAQ